MLRLDGNLIADEDVRFPAIAGHHMRRSQNLSPSLFFEGVDCPGQGKDIVVRSAFHRRPIPFHTGLFQQAVIDGGDLYRNINLPRRHIEALHQGMNSGLHLVGPADDEGIRITMTAHIGFRYRRLDSFFQNGRVGIAQRPGVEHLDAFSRFGSGHRPDRSGVFIVQALAVGNSLQGLFQGDIVEVHRQCPLHAVIDDEIDIP